MTRGMLEVVAVVVVRPWLWITAIRVLRSHIGTGWSSRRPYLPVPARAYLEFRLETQYGHRQGLTYANSSDVVKYLEWVKDWNRRR